MRDVYLLSFSPFGESPFRASWIQCSSSLSGFDQLKAFFLHVANVNTQVGNVTYKGFKNLKKNISVLY
jgi:hypothetical protein